MAGKLFSRLAKKSAGQRARHSASVNTDAARAAYGRNALHQARISNARANALGSAPGIALPARATTGWDGMRQYAGAFSAKVNVNPRL